MSDGLSWAAARQKAEDAQKEHIKSGKFKKEYVESDIIRTHSKGEIRMLVTRLIIHQLGGFAAYLEEESSAKYDLFMDMSEKAQKRFLSSWARKLGFEIKPTDKIKKLKEKLEEFEAILNKMDDT